MKGASLQQLPAATRRVLAGCLALVALGYAALLATAYLQLTPPSSLYPDLREIDRLLFRTAKPVSQVERLLEATGGEMSGGGTMRPAFTDQSTGWDELTKAMTADELAVLTAQREAERLALLDWIRQGASRTAYEADDHPAIDSAVAGITPTYLVQGDSTSPSPGPRRIRLRTLIADRCATCHSENGRHDTARFIALDSYDQLQPRLRPETTNSAPRRWLLASLLALLPLAILVQPVFWRTNHSRATRIAFIALTSAAVGASLACWFLGQPETTYTSVLLSCAMFAAIGLTIQIAASVSDLLAGEQRSGTN